MKVTTEKINFYKSDRILFDGKYISNGHVIFDINKIRKKVAIPENLKEMYYTKTPFDFNFTGIENLNFDMARIFKNATEKKVDYAKEFPLFLENEEIVSGEKIKVLKNMQTKEFIGINSAHLNIFPKPRYLYTNGFQIGIFNGNECIGLLMTLSFPELESTLKNIMEEGNG